MDDCAPRRLLDAVERFHHAGAFRVACFGGVRYQDCAMRYIIPLFCSVFMLVGLGLAWKGVRDVLLARRSASWPKAQGTITRSAVKESSDSDGTTYSPDIEYSYLVDGGRHTAGTIRAGMSMSAGRKFASAFTSRYTVGQNVTVAYDPENPTIAVLEPGLHKQCLVGLAGGFGFAFMGAWFLLMAWLMST